MVFRRLAFLLFALPTMAAAAHVEVQRVDEGWQLLVDSQPYVVRGVSYNPTKVGESPDVGNLRDWMVEDDNRNGKIDAPYEAWVDANRNNEQDPDEPTVGDFQLLKEMGVNTIRIYHAPSDDPKLVSYYDAQRTTRTHFAHAPNKALLRDLFQTYGIRVAMGDFVGAYTVLTNADWKAGTDYRDPGQRDRIRHSVETMVRTFKDEPYILLWVLGNENNLGNLTHTNASRYPKEYALFIDELARRIHELDPDHPVAICNGETQLLKQFAKYAPHVDIIGLNSYRRGGFGSLWRQVKDDFDRPVLMTEFGTLPPPLNDAVLDEDEQARQHKAAWCDIEAHVSGGRTAPGNAIGGFAYEWLDQWWYAGKPFIQNASASNAAQAFDEWQGLNAQGNGRHSPFLRQPRRAYLMYQSLWTGDEEKCGQPLEKSTPKGIPWQIAPSAVDEEEAAAAASSAAVQGKTPIP